MMSLAEDKLQAVFAASLNQSGISDYDSLAYGVTKGWDSVAHMGLVAEIEAAFDVMLSTDDVIGLSSYPVAKSILARYDVRFDDAHR